MSTRWYRTGTVTVTQGSVIVTGVDTQWTSQTVAGDLFTLDGSKIYEVASIESNTSLTLGSAITESSGSGLSYGIARNVNGRTTAELAGGVALLIEEYEALADSAGGGKFADGTVAYPGITFTDDTNTGLYRIGADNLGVSCNGTKVLDIGATGVALGAATGGKKAAGTMNAVKYYLNGTDISAATTSAAGLVELATDAEFDSGADTARYASVAQIRKRVPLGFKNLLINGAFFVNQRAYVSGTATTAANQYTLDRWRVVTSGEALSWTTSNGTRTVTAPAGGIEQVVEGTWLQSGTYTISWTGTATCAVGGTARTNGEAFAIIGGSNVTVKFSGGTVANAQLGLGGCATPFEQRPHGLELALCQRYFWKQSGYSCQKFLAGMSVNSEPFPVEMRAIPTVTIFSQNSGASGKIYNFNSTTDLDAVVLTISTIRFDPALLSGGATQGNTLFYYVTASAEL